MKISYICSLLIAAFSALNLQAQTNRLFVPFLDKESQSNVVVKVCDLDVGQPCPIEYTNTISNTNLLAPEEQKLIRNIFIKYKGITTNIGPDGALLDSLYKTNYTVKAMNRTFNIENWIARYQYTNSEAFEIITFGGGISIQFRNTANDGYNVSINRSASGTLLSFGEIKKGLLNGLFVRFDDDHPQGTTWDNRLANFNPYFPNKLHKLMLLTYTEAA